MNETKLTAIDQGLIEAVADSVKHVLTRETANSNVNRVEAAALSNYQPSTRATMGNIGYMQSGFISSSLLPEIVAAPDGQETASFPTWGREFFFSADDVVGVSSATKRTDLAITWTSKALDVHAKESYLDPREARAAAAVGIDIASQKTELARMQVETRKEVLGATLLTTTSNYASASYYETLSGTNQWSHTSSTPITAIVTKREALRAANGIRPNYLWLSPNAFRALQFNPTITALTQYTGTKTSPNTPASLETLAALFGMSVVVGDAVYTATVGGSFSDVWGDCAGLLFVGGSDLMSPKFGATFTSAGYPKVITFRDDTQGAEGSDVYRYVDCYRHIVTLSSAGYLWSDVTSY